jgi:hypothetical protein
MKFRCIALISALAALLFFRQPSYCVELVVTADVPPGTPSLTTTILKFTDGDPDKNPWTNSTEETTIDFGELTYKLADGSNAGAFYSKAGYCVMVFIEPFGTPFNLMASCTGVSDSDGHSLPVGSFGMIPVYSNADKWKYAGGETVQGDIPSGAQIGTPGPAVPGGIVYGSESGIATARIIQLYLALSPLNSGGGAPYEGYVPIPLTQAPGHYTATVTLTFAPK